MKIAFLIAIFGLLGCCVLAAQTETPAAGSASQTAPLTIKGHTMGESFLDFEVISHGGHDAGVKAFQDCAALVQDKKLQRKHRNDLSFQADLDECLSLADAAEGKKALLHDNLAKCLFVSKRLVEIKLTVLDRSFDRVEEDLMEKTGSRPDDRENVQYENGFGATFSFPRSSWTHRSDVMIVETLEPKPVFDFPNVPKIYPVTVQVVERLWLSQLTDEERRRPSSMD